MNSKDIVGVVMIISVTLLFLVPQVLDYLRNKETKK